MGFYLELIPNQGRTTEFKEGGPPASYWVLYAIGVFAVICMGAAAYQVLGGLLQEATFWDWTIFFVLGLVLLLFTAIGFKMAVLRRFVRIYKSQLQSGYYCFRYPVVLRQTSRDRVREISLFNQKPAPNIAPQFHDDPQYFIRGHWRLVAYLKSGRPILIDKHVEKSALEPINEWATAWWAERDA